MRHQLDVWQISFDQFVRALAALRSQQGEARFECAIVALELQVIHSKLPDEFQPVFSTPSTLHRIGAILLGVGLQSRLCVECFVGFQARDMWQQDSQYRQRSRSPSPEGSQMDQLLGKELILAWGVQASNGSASL